MKKLKKTENLHVFLMILYKETSSFIPKTFFPLKNWENWENTYQNLRKFKKKLRKLWKHISKWMFFIENQRKTVKTHGLVNVWVFLKLCGKVAGDCVSWITWFSYWFPIENEANLAGGCFGWNSCFSIWFPFENEANLAGVA